MPSELIEEISHVLKTKPNAFHDRRLMESILSDLLPAQRDKVQILLTLYFDLSIHKEIQDTSRTDIYFVNRIAAKLNRDYGTELEKAKDGVNCWIGSLRSIKIPKVEIDEHFVGGPIVTDEEEKAVYIPCGVGKNDYGFFIRGVNESGRPCEHPLADVYAVILGYLQRSLDMKKGIVYKELQDSFKIQRDYQKVYRLIIILLILLKNNYFSNNKLRISFSDWTDIDLKLAYKSINRYAKILCSLADKEYQELVVINDETSPISVGTQQDSTISIVNSKERISKARYIWNECNITYRITEDSKDDLKLLLSEAFNFDNFLSGQFEVLKSLLNSEKNKLCIMPTGSGKSLIFYFLALLQPSPTMILCPTKILIQDQCDILKNKHEIDDIQLLREDDSHEEFHPKNKFIFLTPLVFLSRKLIKSVISLSNNQQLANFILDEVHCISNWSHDFRPEYLMISFNLDSYVDRTRIISFTATADYTAVKDLIGQLSLNEEGGDILAPIELRNAAQCYNFIGYPSQEEGLHRISNDINQFLNNDNHTENRKLIVFTKSKETSRYVRNSLSVDSQALVQVFSSDNRHSFSEFASNIYNVLIGDSDVGIGINLPNVTDTYHYGLPVSKSQFVQEIGRAGRDGGKAYAEVVFPNRNSLTAEVELILHRNTPISKIISTLQNSEKQEDLLLTFNKIFGGIETQDEFEKGVIDFYNQISSIQNSEEVKILKDKNKSYDECLSQYMRYLYVLFRVGYIFDWYIENYHLEDDSVIFFLEISHNTTIEELIHRTSTYLHRMGDYKATVNLIRNATTVEELVRHFISWHYNQFLYHHREQLLEMYDFLEFNQKSTNEQISLSLKEYFSLSLLDVKEDATKINKLSIKDIYRLVQQGVSQRLTSDIERSIANEYSSKHDFLIFLNNIKNHNQVDSSRLERTISDLSDVDYLEMIWVIEQIYVDCSITDKLELLNVMCKKTPLRDILNSIYAKIDKDVVYFYILSKCGNFYFAEVNS